MKSSLILFVLCVVMAVAGQTPAPINVHQVAAAVDNRYNNLRSLEADFTEIYQSAGSSRTEAGTVWLKRPGKMRWEYRTPREKLFITNGNTAWFYVPGEQQARKTAVKNLDDLRSPLRYLLGKTKLEKEFDGLSAAPDVAPLTAGDIVLRGVPKGAGDRINQVLLEIGPDHQINRIVIEEADGSTTEFRFQNQKENVQLTDQRFRFTPPPGVETIEVTQAGIE